MVSGHWKKGNVISGETLFPEVNFVEPRGISFRSDSSMLAVFITLIESHTSLSLSHSHHRFGTSSKGSMGHLFRGIYIYDTFPLWSIQLRES